MLVLSAPQTYLMTNIQGDLAHWRRAKRAELLASRIEIPQAQRTEWTAAISAMLVDATPKLRGIVVGFCWPYRGEVDPRFIIYQWRVHGARAALPVVIQRAAPLQFREWSPGVRTTKGVFDLPVPEGTPVVIPRALLIPPIGFDSSGYRLGYGGGYFDRTLAAMNPQPLKVAIAFETSRMETIRPQSYDIPMDFVVTERGIHQAVNGAMMTVSTAVLGRALERLA